MRKLAKYKSVMRYHLDFGRFSRTVCSSFVFCHSFIYLFSNVFFSLYCSCHVNAIVDMSALENVFMTDKIQSKDCSKNEQCTLHMYAIRISSFVTRISIKYKLNNSWLYCTIYNIKYIENMILFAICNIVHFNASNQKLPEILVWSIIFVLCFHFYSFLSIY